MDHQDRDCEHQAACPGGRPYRYVPTDDLFDDIDEGIATGGITAMDATWSRTLLAAVRELGLRIEDGVSDLDELRLVLDRTAGLLLDALPLVVAGGATGLADQIQAHLGVLQPPGVHHHHGLISYPDPD